MNPTPEDILKVAELAMGLCGLVLDETKDYLIKSRLVPIIQAESLSSYSELVTKVRANGDAGLKTKVIDALTTNETLFFRDDSPFNALKFKALPEMIDAHANTAHPKLLRIWSAACSTGQEPYSMAMTIRDLIPDVDTWNINIKATDISDAAIKQASRGLYSDHEIGRGLDATRLSKYFERQGDHWKAKDELRSMISFASLNLLKPFDHLGTFDIIFCRNVAIYFSPEDQKGLFNRLADRLSPNGYLFVGSSESLSKFGPRFFPQHHCKTVFYQPNRVNADATAA